MYTLYHHPACPFSRKVRLVLAEKGLEFTLVCEEPWKYRPEFIALNPAGEIPVLEEPDGHVLCGHRSISEYIDETTSRPLFGSYAHDRAEVRRLCDWFDDKFHKEVSFYLIGEKILKRLCKNGAPDSDALRAGKTNILGHMTYMEWLLKRRKWLAGETFSMADVSAAAQFSVLDYIGEVPWDKTDGGTFLFEETKNWYARIKSRPVFRPLLADRIPGSLPAAHYADLDF
jgi:glutathione S-transferase